MNDRDYEERRLAVSLCMNPQWTPKELAESVGISKATFYRVYASKGQLELRIAEKARAAAKHIFSMIADTSDEYETAFLRCIELFCQSREYIMYLCVDSWTEDALNGCYDEYRREMDLFFLRGQQAGAFRMDIPAEALSEYMRGVMTFLFIAVEQGRIAPARLESDMKQLLLHGLGQNPAGAMETVR